MPNWHSIEEALALLIKVREAFEEAVRLAIDGRNEGSFPALEVLADECNRLTGSVLAGFGQSPASSG